jgi:hypothetical protein
MKNFFFILITFLSFSIKAQSEEDIVSMLTRACRVDSINSTFGYVAEGDSITSYNFLTVEGVDMGTPTYDFNEMRLLFDVGSNLLMARKPFGKVRIDKYSKSKAQITIVVAGAGDREKMGKYTAVTLKFTKPKNGKWMLAGSKYIMTEF